MARTPHDSPEHCCTWACPSSRPLDDIRQAYRDIGSGMTPQQLEGKYRTTEEDRHAAYRELGLTDDEVRQIDAFTEYCQSVVERELRKGVANG